MRPRVPPAPFLPALLAATVTLAACSAPAGLQAPPGEEPNREAAGGDLAAAGRKMADAAARHGVEKVVVVDLLDARERPTPLGRLLADHLAQALLKAGLAICDRDGVEDILAEHDFQRTGMVDPGSRAELGRMCGPHALVRGHFLPQRNQDRLRVDVQLVHVDTSQQLAAETAWVAAEPVHLELLVESPAGVGGGNGWQPPREGGAGRRTLGEDRPRTPGPVPASPKSGSEPEPEPDPADLGLEASSGPFQLELASCTFMPDDHVECSFTVHNQLPGSYHLSILGSTRLLDTAGVEYPLRMVLRGETRLEVRGPNDFIGWEVPPSSHTQLELVFTGISRRKKKVQVLALHLDGLDTVHFHDFFFHRLP